MNDITAHFDVCPKASDMRAEVAMALCRLNSFNEDLVKIYKILSMKP